MDDKNLTEEKVEKVDTVKSKRGRPPKVKTESAVSETNEVKPPVKPPVDQPKVEEVKTNKKVEKTPVLVKELSPCDTCDYVYGSLQCKHGCIHYKRK